METKLQNWKEKAIDEVFYIFGGNAAPKKEELGGEIDFVRMQDLGRVKDKIYVSDVKDKVSEKIIGDKKLKTFKAGSILIPRSGSVHLNHRAILKENSCVVSHIAILENKNEDEYSTKFLYYLLNTIDMRKIMHQTTGLNLIRFEDLKQLKLNIPTSLETQQLIVAAIEQKFSKIDNAIKNLKSARAKIQLYRKAVLKKAFEKKEGWEEKRIGEVCEKINQIIPQKENFNEFYYLDIASINNEKQRIENPKIINSKEAPSRARQETREQDILYSSVRTYLRNIAIVPNLDKKIISTTGFVVLRPKKEINFKWLFYLLNTDKLNNEINKKQVGTSYPAIRKSDLLDYMISFPPSLATQQKIVQSIESKFSVIDKVEETVNNSLKKAEMLKKSILKSAFEGRLVEK